MARKAKPRPPPRAKRPLIPPWGDESHVIELPDDAWCLVLTFLTQREVAPLARVCTQLHELLPAAKWAGALAKQWPAGINLLEFPTLESPCAAFCALHGEDPLCRLCHQPLAAAREKDGVDKTGA